MNFVTIRANISSPEQMFDTPAGLLLEQISLMLFDRRDQCDTSEIFESRLLDANITWSKSSTCTIGM